MAGELPPPLTTRIVIALNEVRQARDACDPRAIAWESLMNRLLDVHSTLLQANGRFTLLSILDPELDARLSVHTGIKLVVNPLLAPTA